MSYTSKYTAEQIEDKLTQVFDSTLQTKEIELTSNGTTELTADAGFLGLKSVSVNVNVNVPQEGGGDAPSGVVSEYYRIDWDKATEAGWISDGKINAEVLGIFSAFYEVVLSASGMSQFSPMSNIIVVGYAENSIDAYLSMISRVRFVPFSVKAYQGGTLVLEQTYNTFKDAYPGLDTQGIMSSITEEEFYTAL